MQHTYQIGDRVRVNDAGAAEFVKLEDGDEGTILQAPRDGDMLRVEIDGKEPNNPSGYAGWALLTSEVELVTEASIEPLKVGDRVRVTEALFPSLAVGMVGEVHKLGDYEDELYVVIEGVENPATMFGSSEIQGTWPLLSSEVELVTEEAVAA